MYDSLSSLATSPSGSEFALGASNSHTIYNSSLSALRSDPMASLGAVYSPTSHAVYVSSPDVFGGPGVVALDPTTLQRLYTIDPIPQLSGTGGVFGTGALKISRDGSRLLVSVGNGFKLYPVGTQ